MQHVQLTPVMRELLTTAAQQRGGWAVTTDHNRDDLDRLKGDSLGTWKRIRGRQIVFYISPKGRDVAALLRHV